MTRHLSEQAWRALRQQNLVRDALQDGVPASAITRDLAEADALSIRANPPRLAEPNYARLGLGSADEAEGRN